MRIRIAGVNFHYGQTSILQEICLDIAAGEVFALVGPNGSGKTTLLKAISGICQPQTGQVYLDCKELAGMKPREIARHLAAVEQEIHVGFDFTVREVVALGRIPHRQSWQENEEHENFIDKAMDDTATDKFAHRSIFTLSSGERQRVWLAMALAQNPRILLLDEPISHLDISYQLEILELIKNLADRGLTVVLSIHDLNLAARHADRIALIKNGKIVASGAPQEVFDRDLIQRVFDIEIRLVDDGQEAFFVAVSPKRQP